MVFKGRFFSSKKSDSDGSSNSPRSFGSNSSSPIRSDKKKTKSPISISKDSSPSPSPSAATTPRTAAKTLLKKKDSLKPKDSPNSTSTSSSSPSHLKKSEPPTSLSVSPLVASSLGLNKIKTRSGPLPQESFFNFGTREKGVSLGASNLSRPLLGGGGGPNDARKNKDKSFLENADNGSNSDTMSTESGASRDQSPHVLQVQERSCLQNAESSSSVATGMLTSIAPIGVARFKFELLNCLAEHRIMEDGFLVIRLLLSYHLKKA